MFKQLKTNGEAKTIRFFAPMFDDVAELTQFVHMLADIDTQYLEQIGQNRGNNAAFKNKKKGYTRVSAADISVKVDKARKVDAYIKPEVKAAIEAQYDILHTEKTADKKFMDDFTERTGIKIAIKDIGNASVEGIYDRASDTIFFNKDVTREDVIKSVAMHELTHAIETSPYYKAYSDFALEQTFKGDKALLQEAVDAKRAQYQKNGKYISDSEARQEMVAEYTRNVLYQDQAEIDAFAREQPNAAKRIYDAIKTAIERIVAYFKSDSAALARLDQYALLKRGKKMFERALETRQPQTAGRAYSIETIPNTSKKYVKADRQVIKGDTPAKWARSVEDYINNNIRKGNDV
ncbi:MAG: hypothetical protein RR873_08350, partial [Christensenella sp.]